MSAETVRQARARVKATKARLEKEKEFARLDRELETIEKFGGVVGRWDIARILNVTDVRVGALIRRGQFRSVGHDLWSLKDVEYYKANRKAGKPSKQYLKEVCGKGAGA